MSPNPTRVGSEEPPPFNFWPYLDELPQAEWHGHDFSRGAVSYSWLMQDRWQHVLVDSEDPNVKLVLVLDLQRQDVAGHWLLDLNRLYGLDGE